MLNRKGFSTYAGVALAFFAVVISIILEGATLGAFFKLSAIFLILGGTIGATIASFSFSQINSLLKLLKQIFSSDENSSLTEIFLNFSEKARRNGLLSLEEEISGVNNLLLQKGIRLIVDGSDPSVVEEILFESAEQMEESELNSAKILETAGGFSPTLGIIGTVLGLVHVLENLGAG
ncbi:MAG: MotA/TolQ/ExbB proton channel family protein, partial [Leptospira sp.]|nr:MotA/TolQ/ExbB proton channel family protein [Leptospira sp.]